MFETFTQKALADISNLIQELIRLQQSDYSEETKRMVWKGFLLNLGGYNLDSEDEG